MQVKPMPASSAAVAREVQSKPFLIHTKGTLQDKLWLEDIIWTVLSDELDSKVPGIEVGTKKKRKKKKKKTPLGLHMHANAHEFRHYISPRVFSAPTAR